MLRLNRKASISGCLLLISMIAQLFLIALNLLGATDHNNYLMYINNYIIGALVIICLGVKGASENFLAIAFFGCYLVFLMGQKPFEPYYDVYLTFTRVKLSTQQYFRFSCILFLGLIVTYYAYSYFSQKVKYRGAYAHEEIATNYQALKPILRVLLMITLPCALYMQAKIVLVRGGMAYTSGYLINVDVPGVIKAGYYIYSTVILLILALKPEKKLLYFVLGTYLLIEGGMQLFQGRRALFASTVLFIIWYLSKYHNEGRIKKKYVIRVSLVIAALIVLFFVVEQVRDSNSAKLSIEIVRKLLISTGGSDSVIANTIYRKNDFPASGIAYLLDPLINNPLGNILTGRTNSAQGMTYLQQHNSFSHWISYMTEPSLYLSGHGMGSCYLAEVYLAFGMAGIIVVSIIVGWLINKLNSVKFNDNLFRTGFVFFIVRRLFTLPRDGLLSWTSSLIYLLFTYMLIYPIYLRNCRQKYAINIEKDING